MCSKGGVSVFLMMRQYEPQLYDLLTLLVTLSVLEDDQLKEKSHNNMQLFSVQCF